MAEDKRNQTQLKGQNVIMENRERLKVTGVVDVSGFNETYVDVETELGRMLVQGEEMKIERLSLEQHELIVKGYIYSIEYDDKKKGKGKGALASIFR